jgi:1,4-alpha-glucan branching enzyme
MKEKEFLMSASVPAGKSLTLHSSQRPGTIALMLHAHVPYVLAHGDRLHGTDWLCEAAAQTYIPLLNVFNRLVDEGMEPRLTLCLSPVLCEMLGDMSFTHQFRDYVEERISTAAGNGREFAEQGLEEFRDSALFWENFYSGIVRDFETRYNCDLVGAFRDLAHSGPIELIAAPATNPVLSQLETGSLQAQVQIAVQTYRHHFGQAPRGLWLSADDAAALATHPHLATTLLAHNIEYVVAGPGLAGNRGAPPMQAYAPEAPGHRLTVFQGDERSANQLCGETETYWRDGAYLDFEKKHFPGGHRLWRRTSAQANLAQKQPYQPLQVAESCEACASDFVRLLADALGESNSGDSSPQAGVLVCATFDASLFGQTWFEGPNWFYRVLKKLCQNPQIVLTTGAACVQSRTAIPTAPLEQRSNGEVAATESPVGSSTAWMKHEVAACEQTMRRLASSHVASRNPKLRQILEQCARELLLMQASDWPALSTTAAREYAGLRCAGHINVFEHLAAMAEKVARSEQLTEGERKFLEATQRRDRPFPEIDVQLWASPDDRDSA